MRARRNGFAVAVLAGLTSMHVGAQSPAEEAHERQAAVAAPVQPHLKTQHAGWDTMGMRGFSVALVLGDLVGTSTPDNLPAGAKKALSDMRDFLPYKSYRLLDTHWVLCCSSSQAASVAGRLRGLDEAEYAFYIDVRPANDWTELAVRFNLRDAGRAEGSAAADADMVREREELERRLANMRSKDLGEQHPEVLKLKAQIERARQRIAETEVFERARAGLSPATGRGTSWGILDSTFSMKVGETVVIGTSRLKGDKALIALLTAASKSTPSAR